MTTKPATPLPWEHTTDSRIAHGYIAPRLQSPIFEAYGDLSMAKVNAAYIVAACNAYQRLVAALRRCTDVLAGFEAETSSPKTMARRDAETILRELGEL